MWSPDNVFVQHIPFGDSCVYKFVYFYVGVFYTHLLFGFVIFVCLFFFIKLHICIIMVIRFFGCNMIIVTVYILYKFRYSNWLLWYFTASRVTLTTHTGTIIQHTISWLFTVLMHQVLVVYLAYHVFKPSVNFWALLL